MAKGLRSRVKKVNKQRLRSNVFGPVEEARKERLSAKLIELASRHPEGSGKAEKSSVRSEDVQGTKDTERQLEKDDNQQDMDVDEAIEATSQSSNPKNSSRIRKRGRSKASAAMVFPVYRQGKRIGPHLSARQRKQSLKPH